MDQVNSLSRKIEHVEWAHNSRVKVDLNRMFEEKFREIVKLHSNLQLKQDQLAVKQDLLHTTIVGDSWSMPTPTISTPPFRSPPSASTLHQGSLASSTILCSTSQQTPSQFRPIPSTSYAGVQSTSKNLEEDIDDQLLSFLSGDLELPPAALTLTESQKESTVTNPPPLL